MFFSLGPQAHPHLSHIFCPHPYLITLVVAMLASASSNAVDAPSDSISATVPAATVTTTPAQAPSPTQPPSAQTSVPIGDDSIPRLFPPFAGKQLTSFDQLDLSSWQIDPSKETVQIVGNDGMRYSLLRLPQASAIYVLPVVTAAAAAQIQLLRNGQIIRQESITVRPRSLARPGAVASGYLRASIEQMVQLSVGPKAQTDATFRQLMTTQIADATNLANLLAAAQQGGSVIIGTNVTTGQPVALDQASLHSMDETVAFMMSSTFDQTATNTSLRRRVLLAATDFLMSSAHATESCTAPTTAEAAAECKGRQQTNQSVDELDEMIRSGANKVMMLSTVTALVAAPIPVVGQGVALVARSVGFAAGIAIFSTSMGTLTTKAIVTPTPGTKSLDVAINNLVFDFAKLASGTAGTIEVIEKGVHFSGVLADTFKDQTIDHVQERLNEHLTQETEKSPTTPLPVPSGGVTPTPAPAPAPKPSQQPPLPVPSGVEPTPVPEPTPDSATSPSPETPLPAPSGGITPTPAPSPAPAETPAPAPSSALCEDGTLPAMRPPFKGEGPQNGEWDGCAGHHVAPEPVKLDLGPGRPE